MIITVILGILLKPFGGMEYNSINADGNKVMVRIAKKSDPKRLAELKIKINDENYLTNAIIKIAQDLTKNLLRED